jgi:hypothetical protein
LRAERAATWKIPERRELNIEQARRRLRERASRAITSAAGVRSGWHGRPIGIEIRRLSAIEAYPV